MKNIQIIIICLATVLAGCGDMFEDIQSYLDDGETIYVGKIDTLLAFPGNKRIELKGYMPYGFNQTSCVITWTNPTGEVGNTRIDVTRKGPNDSIMVMLDQGMIEGAYDFSAVTYDAEGNHSIPVLGKGYVYGDIYQESLINRSINGSINSSSSVVNGETVYTAVMNWVTLTGDEPQRCKVEYEQADGSFRTIYVAITDSRTELPGCKSDGMVRWSTAYLPEEMAIDTFYTAMEEKRIAYSVVLKNPGNPFEMDGGTYIGRWGKPKDWVVNAAAYRNGALDTGKDYSITIWTYDEYAGSERSVTNGKIYQDVELPAGDYRFDIHVKSFSGTIDNGYLAVATGLPDGLPDVENMDQAITYTRLEGGKQENDVISVSFSLTSDTRVSLGIVATIGNVQEITIKKVELFSL